MNQTGGGRKPPVQIGSRQHGLHRIGQDALPGAAAPLLPPVAQEEIGPQMKLPRHLGQVGLTHQICSNPAELPLRPVGESAVEMLRRNHAQDGIPQKLQPLVAGQAVPPALVGIGAVGQGILQKGNITKMIAQGLFQIPNHDSIISFKPARRWSDCSSSVVISCLAASMAWRMALRKARGSEEPWALITGLRMPRSAVPPTSR